MKIYREVGSLYIVNRKDNEGYERPVYEIEVDEVVECKDCRHGEPETFWLPNGSAEVRYFCGIIGSICRKDDYCSWGERNEVEVKPSPTYATGHNENETVVVSDE